jgi:prolyl-tRNA synthetase
MVDIIVSNAKKDDELDVALDIYEKLKDAGVQTIIDDRKKERFGFKMSDFELIGFPYAVIVGKKLQDGMVEIVNRKTGEKIELSIEDVVSKIKELIS